MDNCLFCKIAKKELPAEVEYEDEEIIAFQDIRPKAPVHILITPKKHIESVAKMTENDVNIAGRLIYIAKILAEKKGIAKKGYKLVVNVGREGGQLIDHLHLHLLGGQKLEAIV